MRENSLCRMKWNLPTLTDMQSYGRIYVSHNPLTYVDGADIIKNLGLDLSLLAPGLGFMCLCIVLDFWKYGRKLFLFSFCQTVAGIFHSPNAILKMKGE